MSVLVEQDNARIYALLQQFWGYSSFLPLQEETVLSILENEDSLTVLPTGGGKSLCFQLPALLKEGMAVVISPLISLMKDQVDNLKDMGIAASCLNSSLPFEQQRVTIEQIRKEKIKLLYISPERLQNEWMINLLYTLRLSFFVIDEAHCISHWGHDFRENYRHLGIIKERFNSVRVHAFTATATGAVQSDIVEQLRLDNPRMHLGRIDRPNLTYRIFPRKQISQQITGILAKHANEAGIIYCLRRRDVDAVSADLKNFGIANVGYHAGMSDEERHIAQERFSREEVNIIVATVAFGMGIDRSNIRFVIHAGMPKSIEHYQQETGRAGRDGLAAFCYMFYGGGDFRLWSFFAEQSSEREIMMKKIRVIYNFCVQPQCRHKLLADYFGQDYPARSCDACDYCLNELDMVDNALIVAQKILSCVVRVRKEDYGFGAGYVADVLRGKLTEKIERMGHQSLSVFGIMREETEIFIRYMIEQLAGQDFLVKEGEFAVLAVTDAGRQLLRGQMLPVLAKPVLRAKKKEIAIRSVERREKEWAQIDQGLFQILRQKRAELAREKGVPAYIIFSDRTLRDIAAKRPLSRDAFADVYGVGENKLKAYADIFISIVKAYQ